LLFDEEGGGGSLDYSKSGGLSYAVYIRKTDGSPAVLLGEGGAVALSPDGKWVMAQTQDSPSQLRLLTTGAGEPRPDQRQYQPFLGPLVPRWQAHLFSGNEPGKGVRLYVYDVASARASRSLPEGVNGTRVRHLSRLSVGGRNRP
jgi:eukaryotic-like serine/threonine-protein kinase